VRELASRKIPNLEDQDFSGVISPSWIAFTTAEDSRLTPCIPEDGAHNRHYFPVQEDL